MLEIACFNSQSAITACKAGANRIELCADYAAGGITPAPYTLHSIREELDAWSRTASISEHPNNPRHYRDKMPINIMIRPRGGDFTYSANEFSQMKSAMLMFASSNAVNGFVFGILTSDNKLDSARNKELVEAASPLPCTFHRAVDEVADLDAAVETIIDCGFASILTSGGARSASEGRARVAELQEKFGVRVSIILGGGVRSTNALELKNDTRVQWLHSAAITGSDEEVDSQEIEKMVSILQIA